MSLGARVVLTLVLITVLGGIFLAAEKGKSGREQVVFCDVGQGDGYFVSQGPVQIVVDGGLGLKMAECLARHMPMWDRRVEIMVLTHPQRDHMEGQIEVLRRFNVGRIVWTGATGVGGLFEEWQKLSKLEGAEIIEAARGDKLVAGAMNFEVLWPTKSFINLWKVAPGSDLNETSLVLRLNNGEICAYLTGDITVERLIKVVNKRCEILKIAHHGSKTGTSEELLRLVFPKLAVIQVGRTNSYGHPHTDVLDALSMNKVEVLRNDMLGDIRLYFEADGVHIGN